MSQTIHVESLAKPKTTTQLSSPALNATMVPGNARIGILSKLPLEVRDLIWKNIIPSAGQQSKLGILRTCHQLHQEIAPLIYKKEVLIFHISPFYQYQFWLSIVTRRGVELHLRDLQDAKSRGFSSLPYSRLKGLRIEIGAPDSDDPGQMICLWKKALSLTDLLSQIDDAAELPDLHICLIASKRANAASGEEEVSWATDGVAHQTIPVDQNHYCYDEYDEDYEAILHPFFRLRKCRSTTMHIASSITSLDFLLTNAAARMILRTPFGQHHTAGDFSTTQTHFCADKYIRESLHRKALQFDAALDNLLGRTACMLRLERFSTWFGAGSEGPPTYLEELARVRRGGHGSSESMLCALHWRCRLVLAFNPLSARMQEMRFRSQCWSSDGLDAFPLWEKWSARAWSRYYRMARRGGDGGGGGGGGGGGRGGEEQTGGQPCESRWDRGEWHRYYEDGIPCLNSVCAREVFAQMGDPNQEIASYAVDYQFA